MIVIDRKSWFYKNCVSQRKRGAKICQECPFRSHIERVEKIQEGVITSIEISKKDDSSK